MKREELPKDVEKMILKEIHGTEKYMKLAAAYQELRLRNKIMQAHALSKKMKEIEDQVFSEFLKETTAQRESMSNILSPMSEEDRTMMNSYANSLIMMADVIEVIIMEMNQKVKKYRPDMRIVMFDKLNHLCNECKKNVSMLDDTLKSDYATNLFGETADDLFEMVVNKAKSFCNKLKRYEERVNKKTPRDAEVA